jgi:hypothetical protein
MDQIHLNPLVDQIQLALGHISNIFHSDSEEMRRRSCSVPVGPPSATRPRRVSGGTINGSEDMDRRNQTWGRGAEEDDMWVPLRGRKKNYI